MATNKAERLKNLIPIYSTIISRSNLMAKLGYGYGGDRDLYQALGYEKDLKYEDFVVQYSRQDIAKAVIDRPVNATWRNGFTLQESKEEEDTDLEKNFKDLYKKIGLLPRLTRLDKLAGLGKYGVLLMGISDAKKTEDFSQPVKGTKHQLLYVRPFGERHAQILEYEADPSNERYGKPTIYQVTIQDVTTKGSSSFRVHHSRVIHVAEGLMESEVEGTSRLEVVFNRLKDLEKIVGGSAEMFWRGARPGYQGKIDKEYTMSQADKEDLQDELDEFENNLRRLLIMSGVELQSLSPQVESPADHVDIQIQMISAVTGIPKRILTGSERGELASSQDKGSWLELIEGRRVEFVEPAIIHPFVDRCIEYGILPEPKKEQEYSVMWEDLWAPSEKEKVDIGAIRTNALKDYASNPAAESIVPSDAFLEYFLGLDRDQIELITEMKEEAMAEEAAFAEEESSYPGEAGELGPGGEEPGLLPSEGMMQAPDGEMVPYTYAKPPLTTHSYPAPHKGRPGEEGGSLPRDAAAAAEPKKEKPKYKKPKYQAPVNPDENFVTSITYNAQNWHDAVPGTKNISFSIWKNPDTTNIKTIISEMTKVFGKKAWGDDKIEGQKYIDLRYLTHNKNRYVFPSEVSHDEAAAALLKNKTFKRGDKVRTNWAYAFENGKVKWNQMASDEVEVMTMEEDLKALSYPAPHKGLPGQQGGSAPREGGVAEAEKQPEKKLRTRKKQPSEKAIRAKESYLPFTLEKRTRSKEIEQEVIKAINGKEQRTKAPFDVVVGKNGLEVKAILEGKNPKITMRKSAIEKKWNFAQKHDLTPYTVVVDHRGDKPEIYVKKGVGSFRINSMTKINSYKELKEVLK